MKPAIRKLLFYVFLFPGFVIAQQNQPVINSVLEGRVFDKTSNGVTAPRGIDGVSYLPVLTGRQQQQKKHDYLYWEFPESGGQQAVRWKHWKGIRKNIRKGNLQLELYNLDVDPTEQNNIAAQHTEIVQQIEKIMKQAHTTPQVASFLLPALEE